MENARPKTPRETPACRFAARRRAQCGAALAWLARGFAIDVRSLAALRMALALMVLVDLAERLPDMAAHYTDAGVLPRAAHAAMTTNGSLSADRWAWSLHNATGSLAGQAILFLAAACFALSMLVGHRTRLATAGCWLFAVSIYHRNPILEDAGDTILRTVLFWSMFLPLGAAASLDRRRARPAAPAPRQIVSLAGAALLLQICMIYWTTAAEKRSPVWWSEHTALYYTLSLDAFATPLGHRLLAYPELLKWLTMLVYWFEWLGPPVAILPLRRQWPRLLVVLGFWAMHLGTALTMELGALPWISMAIWTVVLPTAFWDRLMGRLPRPITSTPLAGAKPAAIDLPLIAPDAAARGYARCVSTAILAVLALYMIVWNVNQVTGLLEDRLPRQWKVPAYVLGLEQTWRMFAPYPITEDGWYEMRGVLADGSVVNLWRPDEPLPRRKPANVAKTYRNRRWRKYLLNLRTGWAAFVPEFVDWLSRRWNQQYAGSEPQRRVKHVDVIYHIEQTLSPDRTSTLVVPEIVYEGDIADNLLASPDGDN